MPLQLLAILIVAVTGCSDPSLPPARLAENAYVGKTESAVCAGLGAPDREFAGHYGNPPLDFTKKFTGEIKTMVFKRDGYEHYVSFEKQAAEWISISSSSVREGTLF